MAARFPQSTAPVAYRIAAAYASKIKFVSWPASADSVHVLKAGDTTSTIVTRSVSGAAINADGRITGNVRGSGALYFEFGNSTGLGPTEANFHYGASYYGDLFAGNSPSATFIGGSQDGATYAGIYANSFQIIGLLNGTESNTIIAGNTDDVKAFMVVGFQHDETDATSRNRAWANGAEDTAFRYPAAATLTDAIGSAAKPIKFGGTFTNAGNTVGEFEIVWAGLPLTPAENAAITADPTLLIEVAPAAVTPTVTTHPANQTVTAPSAATFTAVFANDPTSHQWEVSSDGSSWANVSGGSGGTTASYTTPTTTTGDTGKQYRCTATNTAGSVTTNAATLTVNAAATLPAVTTHPTSQTVAAGAAATFTAAFNGNPTPTYQWQRNGTNISGATSASYTTASTTVSGGSANSGDVFRCGATNSAGGPVYTNPATLTVTSTGIAPTITTQPASQTVIAGSAATFAVSATGSGLTYQWQRNSVNISGATGASYTTPATSVSGGSANNGDLYRVIVTGDTSPAVTSSAVTLTVNAGNYAVSAGPCYFNTGSGPQLNKAFSYTLLYGSIGSTPTSVAVGTGTLHSSTGLLSIAGLSTAGTADLIAKDADGGVYYQRVTAA